MTTDNNTPFWLEIKTEYIDANLDKVIQYLHHQSLQSERDSFYMQTTGLLSHRASELIETLAAAPLSVEDQDPGSAADVSAYRVLGAYLLVQDSCSGVLAHEAYFFFLKLLAAMAPASYIEDLTELAVQSLGSRGINSLGFSWDDIKRVTPELTAIKLKGSAKFTQETLPDTWYQGRGSLRLNEGFLELHGTSRDEARFQKTASSLPILDERIMVQTAVGSRIKQSEENSLEVMSKFTQSFLRDQAQVKPVRSSTLKSYVHGDMLPARYKGRDDRGALLFESVDPAYHKVVDSIPARTMVYPHAQYSADIIGKHLSAGDIIELEYEEGGSSSFSLEKSFLKALLSETIREKSERNAVLKKVNANNLMTWWTEDGYPAYVQADADKQSNYGIGDSALLLVEKVASNGYVYASIVGPSDLSVDEADSRGYCVEGLLQKYKDKDFSAAYAPRDLSEAFVRGLCRLLFRYQKALGLASERYRVLCVCRILAAMSSDAAAQDYIAVACEYIESLTLFAAGKVDQIKPIELSEEHASIPGMRRRAGVVDILMSYGVDEDAEELAKIIFDEGADPLHVQLAKLVQSCNRIDDVYPAIKTVIKREITKFLSVETEENTDFEEESGPNFGVENSRTEFKTSFFYAPMRAREQKQEKNIFRSLCSFLNTQEGGVLYLGVNDAGYIAGLDSDMEYLHTKIYDSYTGIDGYVRYIQDRMRDYFDLDVRINVRIDALYDGQVVALKVEPYMHGVVEFEGVAYIRNNNESVKMSQKLRRQIEDRKRQSFSDGPRNVSAIREAIREKKVVVLVDYASSSSETVADRTVEPFELICRDTMVWCYDTASRSNKVFKVSRIGSVKVKSDEWAHASEHRKSRMDIFNFTGQGEIAVKLELDLVARNLLLEEYPDSAADLRKNGPDTWLLQTTVCSLVGVSRFYCGLASHIRIIDSPELQAFVRDYLSDALQELSAS